MLYFYVFVLTIFIIGLIMSFKTKIDEPLLAVNFENITTISELPQFQYTNEQAIKIISDNIQENQKIAIVSLSIGDREFSKISKKRLQQYSDLHGYTLEYYDKILNDNYAIMWQKVLAVVDTLNKKENGHYKYDSVFWVDDDIFITNTSYKLEGFMRLTDKDIILSRDCPTDDINVYINSGTYIIRNTELGRKFMNDVINNYDIYNGYFHKKLFHEQSVMTYLYLTKYTKDCEVLPFNILQSQLVREKTWFKTSGGRLPTPLSRGWKHKDFILHLAGINKIGRNALMKKLISSDDYVEINGTKYPITNEFWNS